ncbi:MAG: SsrA-binding protein SmpB [Nitrospirota bacterium]|nr:SsrA-binding protein SmpB [Nitrospirota bacterium]
MSTKQKETKGSGQPDRARAVATNRKALFRYEILERFEAGIVLLGTEVKALREGNVNLGDAFVRFEGEEAFLYQMHIGPYRGGNRENHDPLRIRKLLLHKKEIKKLFGLTLQRGLTVVPLGIYNNKRKFKVTLALVKGKTLADKREATKRREADREISRVFRSNQKFSKSDS